MKYIKSVFKNEPILSIAFLLAIISMVFVPPDIIYLKYCNYSVLCLLFCLMAVVDGIKKSGLFEIMINALIKNIKSQRQMLLILCLICFFISALITNDVALITFIPFSIALISKQDKKFIIFAITLETICANLGSLITPIGNPQNLFLYTYFNISPFEFFKITVPLGIISLIVAFSPIIFIKSEPIKSSQTTSKTIVNKKYLITNTLLFLLCLLTIFKVLPYIITLLIVIATVFFTDKNTFKRIDYILLLTFICFFVFVGNITRISFIYNFLSKMMLGREIALSIILSQIISNVPAATMLSGFTKNWQALIIGTNIGGLGTLIASMASLISYRSISATGLINKKHYILIFSITNILMLLTIYFLTILIF